MTALSILGLGFKRAARHLRLTLVLYVPAAFAALLATAFAKGVLGTTFDSSLFGEGVLTGGWFPAWVDFTASRPDAGGAIVGPAIMILLAAVAFAQVAAAAGVVGTLVERESLHPFLLGVRRYLGRFLRAALVYLAGLVPIAILVAATARRLFDLAGERQDGRLDLVGVAAAAVVAFLLWAPWDLAYDLARVAAVRHDTRSMAFGMLRSLGDVLRRPIALMPLAAAAVLLPLALHLVYGVLRSPWAPSTGVQIAILVVAQQLVMLGRSAIRLWLWGAAVEAHDRLDAPDWCRPAPRLRRRRRSAVPRAAEVEAQPDLPQATEAPV